MIHSICILIKILDKMCISFFAISFSLFKIVVFCFLSKQIFIDKRDYLCKNWTAWPRFRRNTTLFPTLTSISILFLQLFHLSCLPLGSIRFLYCFWFSSFCSSFPFIVSFVTAFNTDVNLPPPYIFFALYVFVYLTIYGIFVLNSF